MMLVLQISPLPVVVHARVLFGVVSVDVSVSFPICCPFDPCSGVQLCMELLPFFVEWPDDGLAG